MLKKERIQKMLEEWRLHERTSAAISCRDCDYIPKVPQAGQIIEGEEAYQVMHNGIRVAKDSYHTGWMTEIIKSLRGHHEPQEEKVFYEVLKTIPPNSIMIELGSFWAYYSAWFNREIRNSKTYLIEPITQKCEIGKSNFRLNNIKGVFVNAFVGSSSDPEGQFVDWDGKAYKTRQVCMDDFVEQYNIPFVHILHADIQGAEHDMLLGCRKIIARNRIGYIFVSTHDDKHESCLAFLREHKLHIVASHTIDESYSGDGLIVARSESFPGVESIVVSKRVAPRGRLRKLLGLAYYLSGRKSRATPKAES